MRAGMRERISPLAEELLADEKEVAEFTLVDLGVRYR